MNFVLNHSATKVILNVCMQYSPIIWEDEGIGKFLWITLIHWIDLKSSKQSLDLVSQVVHRKLLFILFQRLYIFLDEALYIHFGQQFYKTQAKGRCAFDTKNVPVNVTGSSCKEVFPCCLLLCPYLILLHYSWSPLVHLATFTFSLYY